MTTTHDDAARLRAAGQALYGALWQRALSNALGVNDRRVRAWAARETRIPPTIWGDLYGLLAKKSEEVEAQMDAIADHQKAIVEAVNS
jgi:hypothetical protein